MVGIEIRNELESRRAGQLCDLFAQTWWAADRDEPYVRRVLAGSDLVFGLVDLSSDRLVGFARALTDDVYIALLLDLVVARDRRKAGLGRLLMDAVVAHPRLARVESLEVVCRPEGRGLCRFVANRASSLAGRRRARGVGDLAHLTDA